MRYAFEDRLISVVGAADTLVEFEAFITATDSTTVDPASLGVKSAELASLMDMLTEDRLLGFKKSPVTVEHISPEAREAFYKTWDITVAKRNAVIDKHDDMLAAELEDPYSEGAQDDRTIEEIYGLHENDHWDKRSDEDKLGELQKARELTEAQKRGEITADSFEADPNRRLKKGAAETGDALASITDIRAHENADGSIEFDSVIAVKGDPSEAAAPLTPAQIAAKQSSGKLISELTSAFANNGADAAADDENLEIDTQGAIAIYHKIEVIGAKLAEVVPVLAAAGMVLTQTATVQRNNAFGCWFAFSRQFQAEQAEGFLNAAKASFGQYFSVEQYAVNDAGERLVPKGISVVGEVEAGDEHPRLWNFRSEELRTMLTFQKEENKKTIKPSEFIFCGAYEGPEHGSIVYITPRSWFKAQGKMWEEALDIGNLLPPDLKELSPGVYRAKSRDWNSVSSDMTGRGFKENLLLQITINNEA